jgi:hypothetical protein
MHAYFIHCHELQETTIYTFDHLEQLLKINKYSVMLGSLKFNQLKHKILFY